MSRYIVHGVRTAGARIIFSFFLRGKKNLGGYVFLFVREVGGRGRVSRYTVFRVRKAGARIIFVSSFRDARIRGLRPPTTR